MGKQFDWTNMPVMSSYQRVKKNRTRTDFLKVYSNRSESELTFEKQSQTQPNSNHFLKTEVKPNRNRANSLTDSEYSVTLNEK